MRQALRVLLVLLLTVFAALPAGADAPEVEIARGHFRRGAADYAESRFREAAAEFELARDALPLPELDYNLGRCYEALGDVDAALVAYRRFVAVAPATDARAEVEKRMRLLEAASPAVHQRLERDRARQTMARRWRVLGPSAVAVGALTLGAAVASSVLYPLLLRERDDLAEPCPPSCIGSYGRARAYDQATLATFGIAIGAAAVDAALWGVALRARRRSR